MNIENSMPTTERNNYNQYYPNDNNHKIRAHLIEYDNHNRNQIYNSKYISLAEEKPRRCRKKQRIDNDHVVFIYKKN